MRVSRVVLAVTDNDIREALSKYTTAWLEQVRTREGVLELVFRVKRFLVTLSLTVTDVTPSSITLSVSALEGMFANAAWKVLKHFIRRYVNREGLRWDGDHLVLDLKELLMGTGITFMLKSVEIREGFILVRIDNMQLARV
ncbi:MAG: hypothetical protein AB1497_07320 [Bacillota bacterium]